MAARRWALVGFAWCFEQCLPTALECFACALPQWLPLLLCPAATAGIAAAAASAAITTKARKREMIFMPFTSLR